MLMGLGCNAAAIVGCRIIDSPRERLIAILTNAFVPCNGRFPALIAVISMFFTYSAFASGALAGAVMLTALLIVSVAATLLCGRLLSRTLLKGSKAPSRWSCRPSACRAWAGLLYAALWTGRFLCWAVRRR